MYGIVRTHAVAHRIGKNCTQQPYGSASGAVATTHSGEPAWLGFRFAGRLSTGNIEHECFNICPSDAGNSPPPEQWLYMAFDATTIRCQRARLLRRPPTRHQSASFGVG